MAGWDGLPAAGGRRDRRRGWGWSLAGAFGAVSLVPSGRCGSLEGMAGDQDTELGAEGLAQAREALRAGDAERAQALLEARIDATPDPEALRLLGELFHDQGDLARAGAAWFGAAVKGPEVNEAIEAWRSAQDGDFGRMWRSLPKSVRRRPGSARVEALRSRALGQASARTAAGEAGPAAAKPSVPAAGSPGAASAGGTATSTAQESASDGPDLAVGAQGVRASADTSPERVDLDPKAAREPLAQRRSVGGAVTDVDEGDDSGRGFDAAQVIAWVLAAFFVVCAIVGLITILQWLVPGN